MLRRSKLLALAAAAALAPAFAFAEQTPQVQSDQPIYAQEAAADPANTLSLNGAFTQTLTTAYITRGVLLENQGVIYQNVGELYFKLIDEPAVTGIVGFFNSIHDEGTDAGLAEGVDRSLVTHWYEFDWWAGASFSLTPELGVSLVYQEFYSPNGGFGTCKNVQVKFTYADAATPWGEKGLGLNPYLIAFYELDGKAGTGSDEGLYIEVGVSPSFPIVKSETYPVTLSIPITAGFGFDDFYEDDEVFGFVSGGVALSFPLAFVPAKYGNWTGTVAGNYYYYGDGVDGFNSANDAGDSDGIAVGSVTVGLAF